MLRALELAPEPALASAHLGEAERSRELEEAAHAFETRGFEHALGPPLIHLALLRRELDEVERLLAAISGTGRQTWFGVAIAPARLDAWLALGDRASVEAEAPSLLVSGAYVEPFGLRALGVLREDDELVVRAAACFEAMRLDWHAAQTRALLSGGAALDSRS